MVAVSGGGVLCFGGGGVLGLGGGVVLCLGDGGEAVEAAVAVVMLLFRCCWFWWGFVCRCSGSGGGGWLRWCLAEVFYLVLVVVLARPKGRGIVDTPC